MPADDDKRAAQTAFMDADTIKAFYRQIVSGGSIVAEGESLTQQIAHDLFPEIAQPDMQREIDLEPER